MANIKLMGHTWDTSGIYDAEQEKTQAEVNSGLKTAINNILTDSIKMSLLQLAQKVAYIDNNGREYYKDLSMSLYNVLMLSVTNTLTHVTSSNDISFVPHGSAYSATITAANGYTLTGATVSITMGGVDITSTAYNNGTISIDSVTADLAITVTAVSLLPSGYTPVNYIYTSGSSNKTGPYINTGITSSETLVMAFDFRFTNLSTTTSAGHGRCFGIGGGYGTDGASRYAFGIDNISNKTKWYCGIGDVNTWNGTVDTQRHIFTVDCINKQFSVDNTSYEVAYTTLNQYSGIYLFGRHTVSDDLCRDRCDGEFYGLTITDGGTLAYKFYPCVRSSDNAVGIYDIVNDVFYGNNGNNAFHYN